MAKKKSRIINVRLISMAMTGFFYNFKRPRTANPMGMLKYDPIGKFDLQPPTLSLLLHLLHRREPIIGDGKIK
ncbi:large subunit ribosomal protein L33 [Geosmithia morbida]|uniref:Large ribosomal subunit protein bL33m n=1 Tax=Geosmithia morbida TaxID=1094350 RepID=A0A9P5D7B5_9HYPO|nr:large subunit ribosomal protein L33 [Geosmithia morbida]KAF4125630.1 large subunit ribosomal protein L33 [Geosmithia morbida]